MKWLLFLVTFPCWAGSTYVPFHKDMNSRVTVQDAADTYVRVCSVPIYGVQKDETLKVTSSIVTTNDTKRVDPDKEGYNIGVTSEIFFCDPDLQACRRRFGNNDSQQRDGRNITPDVHHDTYKPYSRVTARYWMDKILVAVMIRVYSTSEAVGTKLNVTSCDIDIERQTQ